jgi:hypothetical protein
MIQEKHKKEEVWLVMVVHACNPSTGELKLEDGELVASLGHRARPCLKKQTNKKQNKTEFQQHPFFSNRET